MNILTTEFTQKVKAELEALRPGMHLTREAVCKAIGLDKDYAGAITLALMLPEFSMFESTRGRGISRRA